MSFFFDDDEEQSIIYLSFLLDKTDYGSGTTVDGIFHCFDTNQIYLVMCMKQEKEKYLMCLCKIVKTTITRKRQNH